MGVGLLSLGKQARDSRSRFSQEKGKLRSEELGDQNIQGLGFCSVQIGRHRVFSREVKYLVIRHLEIFCPCYVLASFLNHEQLIKIAHCSIKMLY